MDKNVLVALFVLVVLVDLVVLFVLVILVVLVVLIVLVVLVVLLVLVEKKMCDHRQTNWQLKMLAHLKIRKNVIENNSHTLCLLFDGGTLLTV